MKRFCKHIDITDVAFLRRAILECLQNRPKRMRPDTIRLFAAIGDVSRTKAKQILSFCEDEYMDIVKKIAECMSAELISEKLTLPPIHVRERLDGNNGKKRRIAVQEIRQLFYDHVAVIAMRELTRLLGEHQVSGRKKMGLSYGFRMMEKWVVRTKKKLYFVKMDIRHYYDSVNTQDLLNMLKKRVKNDKLLWLVETLINSGEPGLNIGSYLSHFLANLYLSDVWHYAKQHVDGVKHALFYMDDILLIGHNKRKLKRAALEVIDKINAKGLTIKPGWQVHQCTAKRPIDIMGMRFSSNRKTLRKRVFRRARRSILRTKRALRGRLAVTQNRAFRSASYHGWLINASCFNFITRLKEQSAVKRIFRKLKSNQFLNVYEN